VTAPFVIRPAETRDLPQVGRLAGQLVRLHHDTDPARFLLVDGVEEGYARWFSRELTRSGAVVLVAAQREQPEQDERIIGYVYGTLEGRDWNMLLDSHGALHDVLVASDARQRGVGRALVAAMVAALSRAGAPRVVLSTMVTNEAAQRVFRACGFRPTMLEMTCESPKTE
jgi:ribosomal protein S18 acetylase RimI-like enzyme